jgi:hypothetical protein
MILYIALADINYNEKFGEISIYLSMLTFISYLVYISIKKENCKKSKTKVTPTSIKAGILKICDIYVVV